MKKNPIRKTSIMLLAVITLAAGSFFFLLSRPPITGHATVTASLFVTGRITEINCNLTLVEGWNLVSLPCSLDNNSIAGVFGPISGLYESVHSYYATDQEDPWKSYKEGLPSWVEQDLKSLNSSRGYWIKANNSTSINVTGTITLPTTIRLENGWNLVGFPTSDQKNSTDAFSDISNTISSVHAYNATDTLDHWKVYSPSLSSSLIDLPFMVSFWGYWINATSSINWVIS